MQRREFLQLTGGSVVTATLGHALQARAESSSLVLEGWLPTGEPLPETILRRLYFLDLQDEPLPNPARQIGLGRIRSDLPLVVPFAIALRLPVTGFGEVTLYADNLGQGYTPADFPLNLNWELARSRLFRVETAVAAWQATGITLPPRILERLAVAQAALQSANLEDNPAQQAQACNTALRESLWAGEEAVIAKAQTLIAQQPTRPRFLFGCNFFGFPHLGSEYNQRFRELFNYATLPFYWKSFEPTLGQPDYPRLDAMAKWLGDADITPKGHPLVWFHEAGIPDWLRAKPYRAIRRMVADHVKAVTEHYRDRIPYYDIINEATGLRSANQLDFSPEQFVELADVAARAAQAGYPQVTRIINSCCLWAENVAFQTAIQRSPFQYVQACIEAAVPFEAIGLQIYYPHQDLFEIDRLLERFIRLGKPIHITELGVSSAPGRDDQSQLGEMPGLWHAPWSETIQADWVEQFYTLCYSKPAIEAVTWWDFADQGHFWPFGGLLNSKLQPKESFYRLKQLIQSWQGSA